VDTLQSPPKTGRGADGRGPAMPALIGADLEVPLATGETRTYVNLDCAASTPAMQPVVNAITALLLW
jgi:hypothetical protein